MFMLPKMFNKMGQNQIDFQFVSLFLVIIVYSMKKPPFFAVKCEERPRAHTKRERERERMGTAKKMC